MHWMYINCGICAMDDAAVANTRIRAVGIVWTNCAVVEYLLVWPIANVKRMRGEAVLKTRKRVKMNVNKPRRVDGQLREKSLLQMIGERSDVKVSVDM